MKQLFLTYFLVLSLLPTLSWAEISSVSRSSPTSFSLKGSSLDIKLGGDHVGNGGGLAESNFAFARIYLEDWIRFCLSSSLCMMNEQDKRVAEKVLAILPQEIKISNQLHFTSEKEEPGFFFLDGAVRIAKTGDKVGDIIFINRDLIYIPKKGEVETITLSQAAAILFHEFGHHTGEYNHDLLDSIGVKVGFFAAQKTNTLASYFESSEGGSGIRSETFSKKSIFSILSIEIKSGKELLLIQSSKQLLEITEPMKEFVTSDIKNFCKQNPDAMFCKRLKQEEINSFPMEHMLFYSAQIYSRIDSGAAKITFDLRVGVKQDDGSYRIFILYPSMFISASPNGEIGFKFDQVQ